MRQVSQCMFELRSCKDALVSLAPRQSGQSKSHCRSRSPARVARRHVVRTSRRGSFHSSASSYALILDTEKSSAFLMKLINRPTSDGFDPSAISRSWMFEMRISVVAENSRLLSACAATAPVAEAISSYFLNTRANLGPFIYLI